jgi:hypothetical protein
MLVPPGELVILQLVDLEETLALLTEQGVEDLVEQAQIPQAGEVQEVKFICSNPHFVIKEELEEEEEQVLLFAE